MYKVKYTIPLLLSVRCNDYHLICNVCVQHLATSNAQILYTLKIPHAHGLCRMAIQAVFRSVILARLLYALPPWWGFAGAQDRQNIYSFLQRSARVGFYSSDLASFDDFASKPMKIYLIKFYITQTMFCIASCLPSLIPD